MNKVSVYIDMQRKITNMGRASVHVTKIGNRMGNYFPCLTICHEHE